LQHATHLPHTQRWINIIHVRASPTVCQILLGKSCVLPTCKKIWQVKKKFIFNSLV
jgi:hypothetical protein